MLRNICRIKKKTVEFQFHSRSCNVSLSINCLQQSKCHKFLKYINKQPIWIRLKFLLTQAWKRLACVLFFFCHRAGCLQVDCFFCIINLIDWLVNLHFTRRKKKCQRVLQTIRVCFFLYSFDLYRAKAFCCNDHQSIHEHQITF